MPPEGGVHEKPNDKCAKMCQRYVGSAFCENKIRENVTGKKTTGGCNNPPTLGGSGLNIVVHCHNFMFFLIAMYYCVCRS